MSDHVEPGTRWRIVVTSPAGQEALAVKLRRDGWRLNGSHGDKSVGVQVWRRRVRWRRKGRLLLVAWPRIGADWPVRPQDS